MHREIGSLTAKVDMILETMRRSEEKADSSRASMHKRVDDMVDRQGKIEAQVKSVQEDMADMKPVVDEVKRYKLIGMGALGMIGLAGIALGVSFSDALKRIAGLVLGRM